MTLLVTETAYFTLLSCMPILDHVTGIWRRSTSYSLPVPMQSLVPTSNSRIRPYMYSYVVLTLHDVASLANRASCRVEREENTRGDNKQENDFAVAFTTPNWNGTEKKIGHDGCHEGRSWIQTGCRVLSK